MKKLKHLQDDVYKVNALLIAVQKKTTTNSTEYKILEHCLNTGNTLLTALKETSNLYAEKNTSNKQQRSIIELIETVEKWCKETGRGLTG